MEMGEHRVSTHQLTKIGPQSYCHLHLSTRLAFGLRSSRLAAFPSSPPLSNVSLCGSLLPLCQVRGEASVSRQTLHLMAPPEHTASPHMARAESTRRGWCTPEWSSARRCKARERERESPYSPSHHCRDRNLTRCGPRSR